jgi:prolyl oligopeptidase
MKALPLLLAMSACAATAAAATVSYPETPVEEEVRDDYFGTTVADPYRWLEDVDAAETVRWVRAQHAITLPFLAQLPLREPLRARLAELWNYERFERVHKRAGRYFYRRNDGLQNQSVLWMRDADAAKPRVLLDPNLLASDGTVALTDYEVSPDGRWLAYATAAAGSDWNEIRVRNVSDARDSGEVLSRIKFSPIAWTADGAGFFYARYPDAVPATGDTFSGTTSGNTFDDLSHQKLYYHRVGTSQDDDVLIHADPAQPKWGWLPKVTEDGRYLVLTVWRGAESRYRIYVKDLLDARKPSLTAPFQTLVGEFEAEYALIGNVGKRLYFRTNKDVQRGRIVAIDLDRPQPAHWQTVVAETADTLQSALFAGDGIVALYMRDATSRLLRFALDGKPQGELKLPALGSIPDLSLGGVQLSGNPGDPELFYGFASFNRPQTNYRVDLKTGRSAVFQPIRLRFKPSDYITEQHFATSKDGTRVPLFVSYRKGVKRDGRNPTLLYGYGGFDISLTPGFSVPNLAWMERGGVFVTANLRGGGEYGKAWHEAGTLARKQNVFDDFAAVAQYLIAQKWTSPQHLAISGRSNGGLLVGATLNQHPELFAAAIPGVGVMDMLRYHRFTIGWAWAGDYGTADTEEGFRYLYAYSPYHNVRKGTRYPAVLVTTADYDDRVVPGHSFKYAAAMQAAQAGDAPVLIRIDVKAGHGAGKPIAKQIEEEADKLAFLARYTGLR